MEEQAGITLETARSAAPLPPAPPPDGTSTVLALIGRVALDPHAAVEKLECVIAMYERLKAKEAELAYNAAKSRILKKLGGIKIVKNRPVLCEVEKGKPQKGQLRSLQIRPARGDRQTSAPAVGGRGYGSLLFRRTASGWRHPDPRPAEAPAERPS